MADRPLPSIRQPANPQPAGKFKLNYAPHFGMFTAHAGSDVVSQLALALPMCLLYEIGIWAAQIFIRKTQPAGEESGDTA